MTFRNYVRYTEITENLTEQQSIEIMRLFKQ